VRKKYAVYISLIKADIASYKQEQPTLPTANLLHHITVHISSQKWNHWLKGIDLYHLTLLVELPLVTHSYHSHLYLSPQCYPSQL